jgi:glutamate synthase domain-containing protein 2/glutamate synthase domain-containing protein 1/glutamate synthase domain-containing protein 3
VPSGARMMRGPVGLFDPDLNHDSCGVGFIVRLDAEPHHAVVRDAVTILVNLEHRGAVGGDKATDGGGATGDGAGLLLQIPDAFLRLQCARNGFELPAPGEYAVGMVFLPDADGAAERCIRAFEAAAAEEGCTPLGWREVPIDPAPLGEFARANQPRVAQVFLRCDHSNPAAFERKLYLLRRRIENTVRSWDDVATRDFFVCSLSARTVVYKGMLVGSQLAAFYPDLRDGAFASAFALIHQRYSTNTFPSWSLAQPFRMLAHNGEINTLRGNVNRMRAREAILASDRFGDDLAKLLPIIDESGSDSAMLDNALELLVQGGRSLPHAVLMTVPEAWGNRYVLGDDHRAFYEYHAAFMEPWDGPAALVFTDGRFVGATLDRNGLRPCRYTITDDGRVILASETGVLDIAGNRIAQRGRLQAGRMLLCDLKQGRVIPDREIKATLSHRRPYRRWVRENRIELRGLLMPSHIPAEDPDVLRRSQHLFGYTQEQLKTVLGPMASRGQEAIGSMGNDAALAVLSQRPQLLFAYFKQLFAQVTNPPIDPLREELVMSLMSFCGRQRNLLDETPEHCRQLKLHHPILTPEDLWRLHNARHADVVAREIDITFPVAGGHGALEAALDSVFEQAELHIADGATLLILTDHDVDADQAPIPSLLATAGLHHHLTRKGLRTQAGIVVATGEAREVFDFALLIGFGANAVCPTVAFSTIRDMAESGLLDRPLSPDEATDLYITAIKKGLLKTFSRMGISTIRSFFGSQTFEAVGLSRDVIDRYFCGTASRVGGIGLTGIAAEALARHSRAFPLHGDPPAMLEVGGDHRNRADGEQHLWSPDAIYKLQQATKANDYSIYKEYARVIDGSGGRDAAITLRNLLRFRPTEPVPLDEVEPVEAITARFVGAAMSYGSISKETHEAIAIAMNRVGARSNSGEGGEDPARYVPLPNGDSLRSRTKQIASGRFGVTIEYLVNADELQIKMAQGAKPGEGGQLPGQKVNEDIARVLHTTPGVTLISPPPHHDIYSIEDLAQLIHDLKTANPAARVSVKLVSEVGVGTIAAGVAKAKADMVLISGHDGGTGASPLTAIKHCGLPWELGLAETHRTLIENRLRDRIRVQTDGQLRTGRDLVIAALLGAEEFGFGSVLLVTLGCVMMRKCHLNTCPVGVATQDPELRKRFTGKPDYVERFLRFVAQDFRERMAELGFRTVDEMVGRSDLLEFPPDLNHPKARMLDFGKLLGSGGHAYCTTEQDHGLERSLDHELKRLAEAALERGEPVRIDVPVRNVNRAVGAMLSGEIAKRYGLQGLPDDTIRISLKGSAGQSLGAFLSRGVTIRVQGDANDYLGKGLSGGRIIVVPPADAAFAPHENIVAGNVVLYGATSGQLFCNGVAGERFAVRNSGAEAVVEGVGDHGCEYMTGGTVVILGPTGYNFAAGMSGGVAYVYNDTGLFDTRCNLDMVDLEVVNRPADQERLRSLIETHIQHTGSPRASAILQSWERSLPLFVKVMPIDYRRSLERMRLEEDVDRETLSATEEVFSA